MQQTDSSIFFYQLTEIFISGIGAILLLSIWQNIRSRFQKKIDEDESQKRLDKGLLYLSLALMVWMVKGFLNLTEIENETTAHGLTILFSLINSLFFVLSLFYFDHAPSFLYRNKKNIRNIIVVFAVISVVSFVLFVSFDINETAVYQLSTIPDIIISGLLSYLLAFTFYKTFKERHLNFMAVFTVISFLIMFVVQLPEAFSFLGENIFIDLLRIFSKISVISLCLVLATSWVIELAETPTVKELKISFTDWQQISLSIPSKGIDNITIDFGGKTTQFRNLLKFAIRRKYAPVDERCIEIIKGGEIQGQVYLTRIIEDINNHLPDEKSDRKDLFTFIGLGKYRVRFLPENIHIESTLLHEFTIEKGNEKYEGFLSHEFHRFSRITAHDLE